jgi:hypothetical protein
MAYTIYGTNEPYNGKVVKVGIHFYTTVGGTIEGTSKQLTETATGKAVHDEPPEVLSSKNPRMHTSTTNGNGRNGRTTTNGNNGSNGRTTRNTRRRTSTTNRPATTTTRTTRRGNMGGRGGY